ncbi:hypothetical protein D1610_04860 [Sphingomonas gilva]|uniref:XRE family transcriptional regulator n=1 Tax=Sphingomonas gilva TaxID=2305907 RepID=A0A396RN32_9SPHN|nr:hypothetical protein [Sphingomonas gilva]RHW17854.1 hypothetical protein D1610_04860 [Sphingomonas gilva]
MALLREIQGYIRSTGMKPTVFGRAAVNDPRLVTDLKRGREPGARLSARVRAFIAAEGGR